MRKAIKYFTIGYLLLIALAEIVALAGFLGPTQDGRTYLSREIAATIQISAYIVAIYLIIQNRIATSLVIVSPWPFIHTALVLRQYYPQYHQSVFSHLSAAFYFGDFLLILVPLLVLMLLRLEAPKS